MTNDKVPTLGDLQGMVVVLHDKFSHAGKANERKEVIRGRFIRWGCETDGEGGTFTVAVVMLGNGAVEMWCADKVSFPDRFTRDEDGEPELLDALCRVYREGYNSPTFPGTPKAMERGPAAMFNLLTDLDSIVGEKAFEMILEFYTLYCDPVREDFEDRWNEFGFESLEHCQEFVGGVDDWR